MTTLNAARVALETKLLALPGLVPSLVAWPGLNFTPPASGLYYKPDLIPSETLTAAGAGASTHPKGIYQVSIFGKAGSGMVALHNAAEALLAHFDRQALASGAVRTGVPDIGPPIQEPDWLHLPVSIPFLCL